MKFNQKEVSFINNLIEGQKATESLIRGFRGKNNAEKAREEWQDELMKKVKLLPVKEINFK